MKSPIGAEVPTPLPGPPPTGRTRDESLWVQVRRRDIALFCNLVGSYEGLGIVRTRDGARGLVELMIAPAFRDTAQALLHDLAREEVPLRILEPPAAVHHVSVARGT